MKYNVQMLVTGTVTKTVDADSPYKAKEIASEKYGDQSIILCSRCAHVVEGLSISEDPDSYEVELIEEFLFCQIHSPPFQFYVAIFFDNS